MPTKVLALLLKTMATKYSCTFRIAHAILKIQGQRVRFDEQTSKRSGKPEATAVELL
jgi:hypothetical protein